MRITQFLHIFIISLFTSDIISGLDLLIRYETKKSRCLNPPRTARRVESVITECQNEVKNKLINEAYEILREQVSHVQAPLDMHDDTIEFIETGQEHIEPMYNGSHYDYMVFDEPHHRRVARLLKNIRRLDVASSGSGSGSGIYHPTLVPLEDKRIAGCLLHCVYAKNNAIDKLGWPTLDGLVHFYSEGVNEHGFFMATLRSVNLCLRAATNKYNINRKNSPQKGESCDLAFDVFDCISDQITGYCLDQYKY